MNSERDLDIILGRLLRTGVVISATIVLLGGILYVVRHGSEHPAYSVFRGEPTDLRTITGVLHDVRNFQARGLIQLGLLLLIATPVLRVAFSVFAFTRLKDYKFVVITLIVLGLLLWSLLAPA